ncbi:hypothetical protein G7046_g6351 [Stylonectria norvegica]|nr:hypothetical protein G7046_g6351 [Stylonectria norvegica]
MRQRMDRTGETCWTCRLRRKRCNGNRPVCSSCATLQITCYNGPERPQWMNGGAEQKAMTEKIKEQIKTSAGFRREPRATTSSPFVVSLQQDYDTQPGGETFDTVTPDPPLDASQRHVAAEATVVVSQSREPAVCIGSALDSTQKQVRNSNLSDLSMSDGWELDYAAIYFDFVFPFLFPFYHPPLVGTGRGWLLTFIRQSDAVFHSILSLSSYFLTVGLEDVFPGEDRFCKWTVWEQTLQQAKLSFEMIDKELREVGQQATQPGLARMARLMESIIQLLIFESFLSKSAEWDTHLRPAITLFRDILDKQSTPSGPHLFHALRAMSWPSRVPGSVQRLLWNTDQAAFRFFTAILIYIDIVASTSVGRAPLLKDCHAVTLSFVQGHDASGAIDLSSVIGCQNWVMLAIGDISTLYSRKKGMAVEGCLSVIELVDSAKPIFQTLTDGLAASEVASSGLVRGGRLNWLQSSYYSSESIDSDTPRTITRIWAHAALLYLHVTVSGNQAANHEIRRNISYILCLLREIKSGAQLRSLAWPICVAGCLALATEEDHFRSLLLKFGDRQAWNTLSEAGAIMEASWKSRGSTACDTRDLVEYFHLLERPVLLI